VKRYGSLIGLRPEALNEYNTYHAAVWPEVLAMIQKCNIRNYSIFLKGRPALQLLRISRHKLSRRHGQNGRRSEDTGVVGYHDAHAASS
jgi:L-rhamnose mutarotase